MEKKMMPSLSEYRLKVRFHTGSGVLEGLDAWDAKPGEFTAEQQVHVW